MSAANCFEIELYVKMSENHFKWKKSENGPTSVEMSETFLGNALLLQENDNFSQTF